jgi:hypothetical protein
MNQRSLLILTTLAATLSAPAWAQQQPAADGTVMAASAPGKAMVARTVTISATVEALDVAKREISLKGPRGNVVAMSVDPAVRNLDKVKVGDTVTVRYVEALSLTLKKDGKELRSATETTDAARAPAGSSPAGAVARQVEATADVVAVDPKTQTVTLKGPNRMVDLHVPDPGQFNLIKVCDQVHAVYTEAMAVGVEPKK